MTILCYSLCMNDQQSKWLQCYLESGNGTACVNKVYTGTAKENHSSKASQLKRVLQSEIVNGLQGKLAQEAPKMLNVLKSIALNTSGDVRPSEALKASSEWLSRCGLDSALVVKVEDTRSHADMLKRVKELTKDRPELNAIIPEAIKEEADNDTRH